MPPINQILGPLLSNLAGIRLIIIQLRLRLVPVMIGVIFGCRSLLEKLASATRSVVTAFYETNLKSTIVSSGTTMPN